MSEAKAPYARTDVYLQGQPEQPKHMFVCVGDYIAERFQRDFSLLDVGCANGDFVAYALRRFEGLQATGVDFDARLVEDATQRVRQAHFEVGDANHLPGLASDCFDVVTMTGTHSIFDDFRPSFGECLRTARAGGRVLVTGIFNPYPIDALIHWRYAGHNEAGWHPGYNLFSRQSVSAFLDAHSLVAQHRFEAFEIPFDIAGRNDPIRSWTEAQPDGTRKFRNGIMGLDFATLVIDLRGP